MTVKFPQVRVSHRAKYDASKRFIVYGQSKTMMPILTAYQIHRAVEKMYDVDDIKSEIGYWVKDGRMTEEQKDDALHHIQHLRERYRRLQNDLGNWNELLEEVLEAFLRRC